MCGGNDNRKRLFARHLPNDDVVCSQLFIAQMLIFHGEEHSEEYKERLTHRVEVEKDDENVQKEGQEMSASQCLILLTSGTMLV